MVLVEKVTSRQSALLPDSALTMRVPIVIEPMADQRFRASGVVPLVGTVEAATPAEAIEKMKALIEDRVAQGAQIVGIDLPDMTSVWEAGAGMFRDDEQFPSWQEALTNCRRQANEDVTAP